MSSNRWTSRFLLLLSFQIILIISLTNCLTHIWGHLHPRAVRMYEVNLRLKRTALDIPHDDDDEVAYADIQFPEEGTTSKYIITMMMVSTESKQQDKRLNNDEVKAFVVNGGVGLNYTVVRFQVIPTEMDFNFAVFGVHPNSVV